MSGDEGIVGSEKYNNVDEHGRGVETSRDYLILEDGGVVIDCRRVKPLFIEAKELRRLLNTDATMFIVEVILRDKHGGYRNVLYIALNASGQPGRNECVGCQGAQDAAAYGCYCRREANGDCIISDPASGGTTTLRNCP